MADRVKRYERLRSQVDDLRREADRAEGALEQMLGKLKDEHGCDSLDGAKKLLKKTEAEAERLGRKADAALAKFEDEWGEVLEDR